MSESSPGFESELRISPRRLIIALGILVLAVQPVSEFLLPLPLRFQARSYALLLLLLLVIAWLLDRWRPWIAKWTIIVLLVAIVVWLNSWLGVPGTMALMAIPTALAAAMLGLLAALVNALGETVLLLFLAGFIPAGVDPASAGVAVVAIWATIAVMAAVYRPVLRVAQWSWEYYRRALCVLEEARDRKAELEQALTNLSHANRQLALAGERMAALRMIAEEAEKTKAAFVARVSHEFRTPLNMILGLVDLMVETPEIYTVVLPPEMREDLRVIHRNCEHLSNMINDVLDLTQMDAGHLALYRERVDLSQVISSSVATVRPLLEKKQLALDIAISPHIPEVYCDRTRVQQVILNLVSNAARFTEEGGITIEVARQDQDVVVSVTDTGPGISQEDAERIFEPFCQGRDELWRQKGGSGLGLSISRQFVKLHGGQMWLESQSGVGASFIFTLPISPPIEHMARPGHQMREDWVWRERAFRTDRLVTVDQLVTPRILVCDETGGLYHELVRYSDEVEFVDTRDLAEATRELGQCPAHAVLLNTAAPDDLWSLVETVRQKIPGTPIIGCSLPRSIQRAVEAGALGYLVKPVTPADLRKAIRAVGKPVRKVLVVDDDPDVLRLFSRMLHVLDRTLEITTVPSGERALGELLVRSPDLVLLDVLMDDMDGWQVLGSMRRDERIEDVPTFLVSAQDPADQPPMSQLLLATIDEGLSLSKLLRCSLELSTLLLKPGPGLDPTPV